MERVDVVVVGAGVIGLSVACELRRAGASSVVVLERNPSPGEGSSARANGGVRAQFTTAPNISFSLYSIGEIERLARAHPETLQFHQNGYLLFTASPEKAPGLSDAMALQRSLGVDTEWVEPSEIPRLAPLVRSDGLAAATFHARDGYLDPHSLLSALVAEARALDVSIRTSTGVSGLAEDRDGYVVDTAQPLHSTAVVDAAGVYAPEVASYVGIDLPVYPVRRNLAFLHAEGVAAIPMCVDLDSGVLIRSDGSEGYVVAYSDPNDPPGWDTSVDPAFIEAVSERIGDRFPALEELPVDPHHCWAGLYPETPDHHSIVGEAAGAPGFFLCAGFGGHGLMHAPAAGRAIAELIAGGGCETFDLAPLRLERFRQGDLIEETAVL